MTDFDENALPRSLRSGVCFSIAIIGACPNENFVSRDLAISDYSDRLLDWDNHLPSRARDIDEPLFGAFESFDATAVWVAVNSRPRAFRCGRLVWIKESWSWEERVSEPVGNGDDSPTIGISFEVYEVIAV